MAISLTHAHRSVASLLSGACLLAAAALWAADAFAQDGDIERGRELYYVHGCYGCHGYNGETGARDLVGTGSVIVENADIFIAFLRARADQAPLLPTTQMPNYPENALSDAEARDIFAYVDSFELDAPQPESVPALQAILELAERPYEEFE
ncbi:MAG TPA: cytochrome c [Gammaproteobacteria bacterium]|nr:cytochrome c [Gammaproteobacteria bacterium]